MESKSSSHFLKKLTREINKITDKCYRDKFADYSRLRKQIKKIVQLEQNKNNENNNHNNNNNNENKAEISRNHQMFWNIVKSEIDKVNSFFTSKQDEINKLFASLGLDSLQEQNRLKSYAS